MAAEADTISEQVKAQFLRIHERDQIDEKMGYSRFTSGSERLGWLVNMQEVTLVRYLYSTDIGTMCHSSQWKSCD
jgi:hypothetical protein